MEEFFINKYGPQALEVLSTPPMFSSIRVNVLKIDVLSAVEDIRKIYPEMEVTVHHLIPDLILIRSQGPFEHQPVGVEVYVDYKCGEAVLRGSHIYSPGILGSSSSCNKNSVDRGTSISVFAIEKSLPRGFKSQISSSKYFLGNGISHQSRKEITTNNKGLALTLTSPKWKMPSFSSLSPSLYYPQNIGSASVGHILRVKPNQPSSSDQILDMCAAPGGKTSHLSTLMNNQGSITACDKSSSRLDSLKKHLQDWDVKNVEVKKMNSTKAEEIFGFEVFDKVLLDAPCTGLGQRPRLSYARVNIKQTAGYSRALLVSACRVLKVSGLLLYSTCSISDEGNFSLENDENIAWALQHLPLTLLEQPFYLGEKGLAGLTQTIPAMTDSGFFIALLRKTSTIEHL